MRFLNLVKPVMGMLPEVAQPDRKVSDSFFLEVTNAMLPRVLDN